MQAPKADNERIKYRLLSSIGILKQAFKYQTKWIEPR